MVFEMYKKIEKRNREPETSQKRVIMHLKPLRKVVVAHPKRTNRKRVGALDFTCPILEGLGLSSFQSGICLRLHYKE